MISRHVIYCDHYPDGAGEAGSNARERKPATVSHEITHPLNPKKLEKFEFKVTNMSELKLFKVGDQSLT